MEELKSLIECGDCLVVLRDYPDNFFDLIITSPPYADSREKTYGGIKPDQYVSWFLPRNEQFLRVLKPSGTFILNIKERVVDGERHTYVIELILELRKQGWLWTEEFIWHKKNCHPGKWPNRSGLGNDITSGSETATEFSRYPGFAGIRGDGKAKTQKRRTSSFFASMRSMPDLTMEELTRFIVPSIQEFHRRRLDSIRNLSLKRRFC